jgi:hypothetical protein
MFLTLSFCVALMLTNLNNIIPQLDCIEKATHFQHHLMWQEFLYLLSYLLILFMIPGFALIECAN